MPKPVSVKGAARAAVASERREREAIAKAMRVRDGGGRRAPVADHSNAAANRTIDSFQNFEQKLGIGTDNPMSGGTYGFNPITRMRTRLEWMHRGSWLAGVAVDVVADDMTRAGVELTGEIEPDQIEDLEELMDTLQVWTRLNELIKWGRLYGGAIAVLLIDGQQMETPLREDTIGRDAFRGLAVFDRWMVEPSINDLVTDFGPELGMPKFYKVLADAPALRGQNIHHTRIIRVEGCPVPYQQRLIEQLWGLSVLERLYDRMVAFDSATTGAAQLVFKAYLRTLKIKNMRAVVSQGGQALNGLIAYTDAMRRLQGLEGVTLIDGEDEFGVTQSTAFSGLSDVIGALGEQLSGALQVPLVRLFGQSPGGLNSDGDSALRTYYDGINQKQNRELKIGVTRLYRVAARSMGDQTPDGFGIRFRSLWQMTDTEKANTANTIATAVLAVEEAGLISQQTALRELRQASHQTGVFSNITEEEIEAASEELPPTPEEMMEQGLDPATGQPIGEEPGANGAGGDDPNAQPFEPDVGQDT